MQVECEFIVGIDRAFESFTSPNEWKARILAPLSLHQKVERIKDGKKQTVLEPEVWCWHAFHNSIEEAKEKSKELIEYDFELELKKHNKPYSKEDIDKALSEIQTVML